MTMTNTDTLMIHPRDFIFEIFPTSFCIIPDDSQFYLSYIYLVSYFIAEHFRELTMNGENGKTHKENFH